MSDGLFAQIETDFILMDERLRLLKKGQIKWLYVVLWSYAVHNRRETLTFCDRNAAICRISATDLRQVETYLRKIAEVGLIELPDENSIIVCGVKSKHPRLKFKDDNVKNLEKSHDADIELDKDIDKNKIVEPPKPGPTPPVKIPNPYHKEFVTFFTEEYQNRFNVKYDFVGGRDGNLIKGLLKTFGLELLQRITLEFFNSDDQFIKEKTGFTVPALKMRANQIAANLSRNKTFMDKLSPAGRETLKNAAAWMARTEGVNAGK